ncbi:hypothetical protein OG949_01105 [Streptomyces scopuliridis]|uniref:hypothetical protein n=1 Tax=Streptomyces scopuliridis TaxID=452529 RepID=UPI002DD7DE3D|nr:hypothetical protein [Streptomyces scopuliridis]WSB31612.1 hypothetical protein OG949_01105 [Streptomyces scopuliridis]
MPALRHQGHVFFGDIALRCHNHKSRWAYDERDIRRAGRVFAQLRLDLDDMAEVQLPAYHDAGERDPEGWGRPDWRRQMVSWMFGEAHRKALVERPYEERRFEERDAWKENGENRLPGGLTWDEFVAAGSRYRHSQNIAGTRPLPLLTRMTTCADCAGRTRRRCGTTVTPTAILRGSWPVAVSSNSDMCSSTLVLSNL